MNPSTHSRVFHGRSAAGQNARSVPNLALVPRFSRPGLRVCAALLGGAALCAALASPALAARRAPPELSVSHAWIRWLPAGLPAAGYLQLSNRGDKPVELVNADSPGYYSSVMLHRTVSKGGVSRMEEVERVAVPAHGDVRLAPGGYHIMLLNPKRTIKPGMHVPITLRFADGRDLTASFVVRKSNAPAPAGGSAPAARAGATPG
jgi:copper(I)-binding protein